MELSSEFLTVAAGAIGVVSGLAAMSIDDLPKKGRNSLISAALVLTVGAAGSAGWMLAKADRKPDCPPIAVPPHIDQGIYVPPRPTPITAPGLV